MHRSVSNDTMNANVMFSNGFCRVSTGAVSLRSGGLQSSVYTVHRGSPHVAPQLPQITM